MDTSHLITSIDTQEIDTEEIYDEEEIEESINEIIGSSDSLEQSSEDWMHDISQKIEEAVENYYSAAKDYIDGRKFSLEEEAEEMASTLHSLDQSLEFLSMSSDAENLDYRNRMLEIKNRLEDEVVAPLTARALENGDFTSEIPDTEVDYLLRPIRDNYLEE